MVIALAIAVMVVARGVGRNGVSSSAPKTLIPAHGGTYVEGDVGTPSTFNPLLARSQSEQDLAHLLFSGLTRVDGSGSPKSDLATDWSVSQDGLTYTFKLRDDALWHDGQPVTGRDVLFTVQLVQSPSFPGDPALARFWRAVTVTVLDDRTIAFKLLSPFAAFPNYADLPIVPRHLLGGVLSGDLARDPFSANPVGSGPFQFAGFDAASSTVTLRANPTYYGGPPYLDSAVFRYYRDTNAVLAALRAGTVQGTGSVPVDQLFRPDALPKNAVVYAPGTLSFTALFFNLRDPLFANPDVRQAIELGIDRESLLKGPLSGRADLGTGPIPVSSWAYAAAAVPSFNPAAAKRRLADGGWKDTDGDGVLEKGSTRLSFPLLVNDDDPQRVAVASEVAQQLQQIGIQAIVQPTSSTVVFQSLVGHQFSAAVFGWHLASGDPDCFQLWHSTEADDGLNFTGLRDQTIDKLLADARGTADIDQRKRLYGELQQALVDQRPAIVLYYPRYYFVVTNGVQGVDAAPVVDPSARLEGLSKWFVETGETHTPAP